MGVAVAHGISPEARSVASAMPPHRSAEGQWHGDASTGMPVAASVGNPARPHHVEPRVKQRRLHPFRFMSQPRHERHNQLIPLAIEAPRLVIRSYNVRHIG